MGYLKLKDLTELSNSYGSGIDIINKFAKLSIIMLLEQEMGVGNKYKVTHKDIQDMAEDLVCGRFWDTIDDMCYKQIEKFRVKGK